MSRAIYRIITPIIPSFFREMLFKKLSRSCTKRNFTFIINYVIPSARNIPLIPGVEGNASILGDYSSPRRVGECVSLKTHFIPTAANTNPINSLARHENVVNITIIKNLHARLK